jgi:hypothetical protein
MSKIAFETTGAFVDSIAGSVDVKIEILDNCIDELKEVFGGEGWN